MHFRACNTLLFIIGASAILQFGPVSSAWAATTSPDAVSKAGPPAAKPSKTVLIFDWVSRSDGKAISVSEAEDLRFQGLVERLSPRIFKLVADNRKKRPLPTLEIVYVREPLIQSGLKREQIDAHAILMKSRGDLRLDSPWSAIYVDDAGRKATIVIRFTDHQSLIDRVVRETGLDASQWDAASLDQETFEHYAQAYADQVVNAPRGATREAGLERLRTKLPPDIFWLFQHSPQTTRGPFSGGAIATVAAIANAEIAEYERRVVELVSTAIANEGQAVTIKTVADIK